MSTHHPTVMALKIVLLGEARVGKTSLLLRYTEDIFDEAQGPTVSPSFVEKRVTLEGQSVRVSIWDTAGQERYHALGPIYYRDADAALLVFDVTDVVSLDKVKRWIAELRTMLTEEIPLVIAGNKCDLEHEMTINVQEAETYANQVGAKLFWTSALANKRVDACFMHLIRACVEKQRLKVTSQQDSSSTPAVQNNDVTPLVIDDSARPPHGNEYNPPCSTSTCSSNN